MKVEVKRQIFDLLSRGTREGWISWEIACVGYACEVETPEGRVITFQVERMSSAFHRLLIEASATGGLRRTMDSLNSNEIHALDDLYDLAKKSATETEDGIESDLVYALRRIVEAPQS